MIALVDVNNFYVSCERLFNPYLINKPVVVLSNNDGCIISRSQEAKNLGIKMGEPLFKASAIIRQHQVQVLSSIGHYSATPSASIVFQLPALCRYKCACYVFVIGLYKYARDLLD